MSEVQTSDAIAPLGTAGPAEAMGSCPNECPRHRARGALLAVAGWLLAANAAVFVAFIPYDPGESMCGVWGCFPPLFALVSMHLLWCVALGACVWAVRRWLPGCVRPLGFLLFLAAVVATGAFVARDLVQWLSGMPEQLSQFWPRRIAYRVLTLTDLPLVQCLLVGAGCAIFGRGAPARGNDGP